MLFILLNFDSSELDDDLPSSLVTSGVSTDIPSQSTSRTDEEEEEVLKICNSFPWRGFFNFFPFLSTCA